MPTRPPTWVADEREDHPERFFIGLFWSLLGSLVFYGAVALVASHLIG